MLQSKPEERRKIKKDHGRCRIMKTEHEQVKAKGK
jgi:hypothetical protein